MESKSKTGRTSRRAPQWPPLPVRRGNANASVAAAQGVLYARGYFTGEITGSFDVETQDAVEAFQLAKGMEITGRIDGETWRRLLSLDA